MGLQEDKIERMDAEADKLWQTHYGNDEEEQKIVAEEVPADTPEAAPVEKEPVEDAPTPAPDDTADYKQKYKTLEGKYRVEVPRLQEEVKKWRDQVYTLSTKVQELETKAKEAPQVAESNIVDTDIAQLEADYPDIGKVVKKLRDGYEAKISSLEKKISEGVSAELSTVKEDVYQTRRGQFEADMIKAGVPDWKELDVDEGFNQWLAELVPYTSIPKLELLKDAATRMDAPAVAKFFLDYKSTLGQEAPRPNVGQGKLEKFVAPSTARVGVAPQRGKQPWLTQAEYTTFMQDSAKGKFNPAKWGGKTEEQVEAMFDRAIAEGTLQ
jgi:BMFP domain-containing protein YqiC